MIQRVSAIKGDREMSGNDQERSKNNNNKKNTQRNKNPSRLVEWLHLLPPSITGSGPNVTCTGAARWF